LSAQALVERYGTHLITKAFWGGTAEFDYSYYGEEADGASKLSTEITGSVTTVSGVGGSTSLSFNVTSAYKNLEEDSKVEIRTTGGGSAPWLTFEGFVNNYTAWVASNPELCAVGDFSTSFKPLWELVALVNSSKATAVETYILSNANAIKLPGDWTKLGEYSSTTSIDVTAGKHYAVYLVGGGGGGEGSNTYIDWFTTKGGAGGGGGGGAAASYYFSPTTSGKAPLSIGTGGPAGGRFDAKLVGHQPGNPGGKGGNTTFSWDGIIITAGAGIGGGIDGGAGGTATANTTNGVTRVSGSSGGSGNAMEPNRTVTGGNAGSLTMVRDGTIGGAGGGNNTVTLAGSRGGGGAGAAYGKDQSTGGKGGAGYAVIFTLE
jgi:hypothetical protein